MSVQVIMKDGRPEWAVLPYADYEALLATVEALSAQAAAAPSANAATARIPQQVAATTEGSLRPEDRRELRNTMMEQLRDVAAVADAGSFEGAKVTEIMRARGLDGAQIAREVGISPVYLKQIESGERQPSEPILRNIARALSVDVKDLSVEVKELPAD